MSVTFGFWPDLKLLMSKVNAFIGHTASEPKCLGKSIDKELESVSIFKLKRVESISRLTNLKMSRVGDLLTHALNNARF